MSSVFVSMMFNVFVPMMSIVCVPHSMSFNIPTISKIFAIYITILLLMFFLLLLMISLYYDIYIYTSIRLTLKINIKHLYNINTTLKKNKTITS